MTADGRPLAFARYYARHAWPVFPLKPHDKIPLGSLAPHGFLDASTDPDMIANWWQAEPEAGIGLRTGRASGTIALDVDPRHGGDVSLAQLEAQHGPLPETVEAITGGGGRHLVFAYPAGDLEIRNCTKLGGLDGLDVRAEGGYIAVAPTIHPSGQPYRWRSDRTPKMRKPADLPDWLLAMLTGESKAGGNGNGMIGSGLDTAKILDGVPEGERDEDLWGLACKLRGADVPIEAAYELVGKAASKCVPPFDAQKAYDKVRRAYARYEAGTKTAKPEPRLETAADLFEDIDVLTALWEGVPPVKFDLAPYLAAGTLTLISGPPKSAKTWIALAWSICLVTGRSFCDLDPEGEHRVLFLEAEYPRQIIIRFGQLCQALQVNPETALKNIRFIRPRRRLRLEDPAQAAALLEAAKDYNATWCVIDSLRRVHGLDENSSRDMANLADGALLPLRGNEQRGVLVIDHDAKAWMMGNRPKSQQLRGSGDKLASADVLLHVEKHEPEGEPRRYELAVAASRVADEEGEPLWLAIHPTVNGGVLVDVGEPLVEVKKGRKPTQFEQAVNIIRAEQGRTLDLARKEAIDYCIKADIGERTAGKAWNEVKQWCKVQEMQEVQK